MRKYRGLFITGTDTGVGKTLVTGGLAAYLRDLGLSPGVMKPAETGCPLRKGRRIPQDASFLKHMAGAQEPLEEIAPYRLAAPLAPQVAAEMEGVKVDLTRGDRTFQRLAPRHAFTLVEGAGGLMVPITSRSCMLHLAQRLRLPVLLVSRTGLGTLNHTLLSLACLHHHQIPVAGIVLNDPDNTRDIAARTNPSTLQRWTSVPLLGRIPYDSRIRVTRRYGKEIAQKVSRHVDLDKILKRAGM